MLSKFPISKAGLHWCSAPSVCLSLGLAPVVLSSFSRQAAPVEVRLLSLPGTLEGAVGWTLLAETEQPKQSLAMICSSRVCSGRRRARPWLRGLKWSALMSRVLWNHQGPPGLKQAYYKLPLKRVLCRGWAAAKFLAENSLTWWLLESRQKRNRDCLLVNPQCDVLPVSPNKY